MTDFDEIGDRVEDFVPDDLTDKDDIAREIRRRNLMSNQGQSVPGSAVEGVAAAIAAGRESPEPETDDLDLEGADEDFVEEFVEDVEETRESEVEEGEFIDEEQADAINELLGL